MAFPTLSRRPMGRSVEFVSNEIKADMEGLYEHRRPRGTRKRRKFTVPFDLIPEADRDLLITHFEAVGTYSSFDWTDVDSTVYTVWYDKPLKTELFVTGWYRVEPLELMEV